MFRLVLTAVAAAAMTGCGPGGPKAAPVEPDLARKTLRQALDAWKAGQKPDALAHAAPPVVVQDFDWMAGASLTRYDLVGDGDPEGPNLRVRVTLALTDARGEPREKTVTYVVGTDPKLTVFRALE